MSQHEFHIVLPTLSKLMQELAPIGDVSLLLTLQDAIEKPPTDFPVVTP